MDELAQEILRARARSDVLPAQVDHGLTADEAYAIQALVLAPRLADGGGRGGWKLGYTSAVMREQMGIADPNHGPLARAMILEDGAVIDHGVTQPRVEPEIATVLAYDVPPDASPEQVSACVGEWRLALEVVDSVWEDYRFDWHLNTADGSSAAFVVLGPVLEVTAEELRGLDVTLRRNGAPVATGRSDAAMGDPLVALHWLVQRLAERGESLAAGDVVITGGLTRAVELLPGDVVSAVTLGGDRETGVAVRRLERQVHPQ